MWRLGMTRAAPQALAAPTAGTALAMCLPAGQRGVTSGLIGSIQSYRAGLTPPQLLRIQAFCYLRFRERRVKYAIAFSVLTAAALALAWSLESPVGQALLLACAVASAGLAMAYALRSPRLLGKRADGSMAPLAWLLFWPFLLLNFLSLWSFRRLSREEPISEIVPGLYLGCRLLREDRGAFERRAIASTLDLTAEFPEVSYARSGSYLCIPLLDTSPPTRDQLSLAAEWIERRMAEAPVLVHCALGHGRSAIIVAAHLLRAGRAATVEETLELVSERRPGVGLNGAQARALRDYAASLPAADA
jgi:diacylglycerol kinase (ATP)